MKRTRLITTLKCHRHCYGCVNTQQHIKAAMQDAYYLEGEFSPAWWTDSDEFIITGGEPLLEWNRTKSIVSSLMDYNPHAKFYLYTTLVIAEMPEVIRWFDGITYTLHQADGSIDHDLECLESLQCLLSFDWGERTFRLRLDPKITEEVCILPDVWSDIKTIQWSNNCAIPEDELILITRKEDQR